jgi:hypothetical protein
MGQAILLAVCPALPEAMRCGWHSQRTRGKAAAALVSKQQGVSAKQTTDHHRQDVSTLSYLISPFKL